MNMRMRYASPASVSDVSTIDTDELYARNERFGTPGDDRDSYNDDFDGFLFAPTPTPTKTAAKYWSPVTPKSIAPPPPVPSSTPTLTPTPMLMTPTKAAAKAWSIVTPQQAASSTSVPSSIQTL